MFQFRFKKRKSYGVKTQLCFHWAVSGFHIEAYFDKREYEKGIKVNDKEFKQLHITRNDELSNWNYTISPTHTQRIEFQNLPVEKQQKPLERYDEWPDAYLEYSVTSECTLPLLWGMQ